MTMPAMRPPAYPPAPRIAAVFHVSMDVAAAVIGVTDLALIAEIATGAAIVATPAISPRPASFFLVDALSVLRLVLLRGAER